MKKLEASWTKIVGFVCLSVVSFGIAEAKPVYFNQLQAQYPSFREVAKRRCQNCHGAASLAMNPYGTDFAKKKSAVGSAAEAIRLIEQLDSDGDTAKNIDEFKAGSHPGDAKSVPQP